MKQKTIIRIIFIYLIFMGCIHSENKTVVSSSKKSKRKDSFRFTGNLVLKGKIIDQNGNALNNVKIDINKKHLNFKTGVSYYIRETISVDSGFCIEGKDCLGIGLTFMKKGYHYKRLSFSFIEMSKTKKGKGNTYKNNSIVVKLEKAGKIVKLNEYVYNCIYNEKTRKTKIFNLNTLKTEWIKIDPNKQNEFPKNCIIMLPLLDKSGKVLTRKEGSNIEYPLELKLINTAKEGGFYVFSPTSKNERENIIHMKNAPENDYVDTLYILGGKDKKENKNTNPNKYFYIKSDKYFGKGCCSMLAYIKRKGILKLCILLFINKDKTRNLETW